MTETCSVCDEAIPDDYGKFDPRAPVYADEFVYHLGCEEDVFTEVYASTSE